MMPWPRAAVGQGADMEWARILAYVTGTVDQELLGAERISGRREPHPEGAAEWSAEAFGRRARRARRDRSSPGPQGSRRRRDHRPTGHYPGLVPQACRPQVRWLEGPSRPGQTSDQA